MKSNTKIIFSTSLQLIHTKTIKTLMMGWTTAGIWTRWTTTKRGISIILEQIKAIMILGEARIQREIALKASILQRNTSKRKNLSKIRRGKKMRASWKQCRQLFKNLMWLNTVRITWPIQNWTVKLIPLKIKCLKWTPSWSIRKSLNWCLTIWTFKNLLLSSLKQLQVSQFKASNVICSTCLLRKVVTTLGLI